MDKKVIARSEPGFLCTPLIGREEVQRWEIDSLVTRLFHGSKSQFISALALDDQLSPEEARQLQDLIAKLDGKDP